MQRDAMKLQQAMLGETPEALDPVDVVCAPRELVLRVVNSIVFRVTDINQPVVAAPAIRMDNCFGRSATTNNSLQSSLRAVGHDLSIDTTFALQESEDRSLTRSPTPALTANSARAEVAFINCTSPENGETRSHSSAIR